MASFVTLTLTRSACTCDTDADPTLIVGPDGQVFFAPQKEGRVGIFDTATSAFSLQAAAGTTATLKYSGAAAVGTRVYFAPYDESGTGIFDTLSGVFSMESMWDTSGTQRFDGAVAVGTRVYFAPLNMGMVATVTVIGEPI